MNPIRYRGYYYDTETGLYYCLSRYYDPNVGRFINADNQLNTSQGILGMNMFVYCLDNPVNMADHGGNKPGDLFNTIDGAARDAAEYMYELGTFKNSWEYGTSIYETTVKEKKYAWTQITICGFTFKYRYSYEVSVKKYTYKKVKTNKDGVSVSIPKAPWRKTAVATVHTHPYVYGAEYWQFSPQDRDIALVRKVPSYVYTATGILRKYDSSDYSDIVVFDDLPKDPHLPK